MKVIGIVNSQGEYQGTKYHNLVLYVTYKETNVLKDCRGLIADKIKLRFSDLNALFSMGLADSKDVEKMTTENFDFLLGKEIEVAYNKFGGVLTVNVLDTKDNKSTKGE